MDYLRETMQQAGYRYGGALGDKQHVLIEIETGKREVWFANHGHAGYGIKWRNTDLEFARSIAP